MFRFDGLRALVTGATSGIGSAIADALADAGADVVRHGLEAGADIDTDLGDPDAARTLAAFAGDVDILVLSASLQVRARWDALDVASLRRQLDVNLVSSVGLLQAFVPGMQRRGFGRVLTLGSVQLARPHPEMLGYAASKAALANVVHNLAVQVAADGVTVNTLSPGVIDTPRNTAVLADPAYLDRVLAGIPTRRVGTPEDCVAAALLLCSREGGYITGQNLLVDGGMGL